jgi:hypothetical protein
MTEEDQPMTRSSLFAALAAVLALSACSYESSRSLTSSQDQLKANAGVATSSYTGETVTRLR